MILQIKVSSDTVSGVVLCDVPEVFTHPFTKCTFSVSDVLFKAHLARNAVNNVIGLAATTSDSVVFATSDRALD